MRRGMRSRVKVQHCRDCVEAIAEGRKERENNK